MWSHKTQKSQAATDIREGQCKGSGEVGQEEGKTLGRCVLQPCSLPSKKEDPNPLDPLHLMPTKEGSPKTLKIPLPNIMA